VYIGIDSFGMLVVSPVLRMSSPNPTVNIHFAISDQFRETLKIYLVEKILTVESLFEKMSS
jgi:hypothetical protein